MRHALPAAAWILASAAALACGGDGATGGAEAAAPVGAGADAVGTRFAVMGHLYPIADDGDRLRRFLAQVAATGPDLVFVLGDSSLDEPRVVALLQESFQVPVLATPGNHELAPEHRAAYLARFPDLVQTVSTPDCDFVLAASSLPVAELRAALGDALARLEPDRPTILLTHHRIWDDTLTSAGPYQHDKAYWFDEIYPVLQGRVDYIFAGNSRRQYFRDLSRSASYGPQNLNAVYWADRVGGITAYSVGMGDGFPKASFVVAEVVGARLLVESHAVAWDGEDPLPRSLVQPIRRSQPPAR